MNLPSCLVNLFSLRRTDLGRRSQNCCACTRTSRFDWLNFGGVLTDVILGRTWHVLGGNAFMFSFSLGIVGRADLSNND